MEHLPYEVLLKLSNYLDITSILKFGQVSKRTRQISRDESLWRKTLFNKKVCPKFSLLYFTGHRTRSISLYILPEKNRKRISSFQMEHLPTELLIKIVNYLDLTSVLKFMQVSKRTREISCDESLWQKTILFDKKVRPEFVKFILDNKCRYLSLKVTEMTGDLHLTTDYQLKHLDLSECKMTVANYKELLTSCNSLQKLALPCLPDSEPGNDFTVDMINEVILKNCKTLQVLDFNCQTWYTKLRSYPFHTIVNNCAELTEFNADIMLSRNATWEIEVLVKNLTPKVKKLSLQAAKYLEDEDLRVILSRCNQLQELVVARSSITDDSVSIIVNSLSQTLEKLDVCDTKISFDKLAEFRVMTKLKFLNCGYGHTCRDRNKLKILTNQLPNIGINLGDFHIAKTWK